MSESNLQQDRRNFLARLKEARIGNPVAQYDVALMYANGVGVQKNVKEALRWAESAAVKGHPSAQYLLGCAYQQGLGTPRNLTTALPWFFRPAAKGNDKAAFKLAEVFKTPQPSVALDFALDAAQKGLVEAQLTVGECFANGIGAEQNSSQARAWYQLAAAQGSAVAQYALGRMYELGDGVDVNLNQAMQWYRQAASLGMPAAQLALYALDGQGYGRSNDEISTDTPPSFQDRRAPDIRWVKYAAKGNSDDFFHLGLLFELGTGVGKSAKQARLWFEKAAERGHAGAMVSLGRMAMQNAPTQANEWFTKAGKLGHPDAQFLLAQSLILGRGIDKNDWDAFYWRVSSARQGHAGALLALFKMVFDVPSKLSNYLIMAAAQAGSDRAQFLMGELCAKGEGFQQDWFQACEWYHMAAEQNHTDAQRALARCYANGLGVKQDLSQTFHWYDRAAAQGDVSAQWSLGKLYASGVPGVQPDPKQAMLLCKKAAKAGFAPAQATLGILFASAKKHDRAVHWWSLAAEQGDIEAMYNLSKAYKSGLGVTQDESKAFELLMKVAMSGLPVAQLGIGLAYATGQGVALDTQEAAKWFILAAKQDNEAAIANQTKARTLLSTAQWAEAVRRAESWFPTSNA